MLSNSSEKLDPRVRRTRKLLQNAFMELVREKGFSTTTVQEIADKAEINRATFYAHYNDKFELHDEVLILWFRKQLEQYQVTIDSHFCEGNLRNIIYAVCDFQGKLNAGCHPSDMQYKPDLEKLIQTELYSIVYSWMQSLDGITHPEISAAAISWAIFGAGSQWSRNPHQPKEIVANTVINLIRDGLKSQDNNLLTLETAI